MRDIRSLLILFYFLVWSFRNFSVVFMVGDPGLGHMSTYLYVTSFLELRGSRPRLPRSAQSGIRSLLILFYFLIWSFRNFSVIFMVGDPGLEPGT